MASVRSRIMRGLKWCPTCKLTNEQVVYVFSYKENSRIADPQEEHSTILNLNVKHKSIWKYLIYGSVEEDRKNKLHVHSSRRHRL